VCLVASSFFLLPLNSEHDCAQEDSGVISLFFWSVRCSQYL